MERNKVTLAVCPKCNAVCELGHDDDGQVHCAKCEHTFMPKVFKEMEDSEYKAMLKTAKVHQRGGWTAYNIN